MSNTYARPAWPAWSYAPTIAVEPEIATEEPRLSPATVSEPFSSASCFPIGVELRGLAATAEALHARRGRATAPAATRLANRDVRM
jgi:hypothetical protein